MEPVVVVAAVNPDGSLPPDLAPPPRDPSTSTVPTSPDTTPEPSAPEASPVAAPDEGVTRAPQTTETTEPEATPTTTEAPAPTSTTEAPPPPTTTAPPPPDPAPPAPDPVPAALSADHADGTQVGDVSWYDLPGARAGVCAHRTIEKGTVVTVTNLDTGESITCTVDDRGPYTDDGKVLDLHRHDFSRLAPLEQGIFPARLDW